MELEDRQNHQSASQRRRTICFSKNGIEDLVVAGKRVVFGDTMRIDNQPMA